jgi:hypothetical protein
MQREAAALVDGALTADVTTADGTIVVCRYFHAIGLDVVAVDYLFEGDGPRYVSAPAGSGWATG